MSLKIFTYNWVVKYVELMCCSYVTEQSSSTLLLLAFEP